MSPKKITLLCGAVLLVAFGAGFAYSELTRHTDYDAFAEDHTEAEGAAHAEGKAEGAAHSEGTAHADNDSHGEGNDPDAPAEHAGEQETGDVVVLTERQAEAAGIGVVAVGRGGGNETRLLGWVEHALGARTTVSSIPGGRVEDVQVTMGASVKAGQTLAVVISSEAASLRADAVAAVAAAEAARLEYERASQLAARGVSAQQNLEVARARSVAADAAAKAAEARVEAVGSPDIEGRVAILSPISGVVGRIHVTPGGYVAAGGIVAEVSDPSRTELVFTAPAVLAGKVTAESRIEVTGPSGSFEAAVIGVAADVREQGNATFIRACAASGTLPPAGSPVTGIIVTDNKEDGLTVPADAVQTLEGQSVVFVATEKGFRAKPVLAGRRAGDEIEILHGLDGSERIVGTNAFLLKAEFAKGGAEHGH
ncbi:efflux RND transporter periplasmic adaptor subunit [Sinorhizobium arboris]|uniref:efflux RND transporter periplasmic adaptor subunit n=1 Tax=Sinorhizobium arboris TaxID=76745 RepID=UPI0004840A3B|nr:efflux RND transporter periplasmic adaptor subunit [Sinorhizobium arboris]